MFHQVWRISFLMSESEDANIFKGIAIHLKERSFHSRKVLSAKGSFLYGRRLLNKVFSKISL